MSAAEAPHDDLPRLDKYEVQAEIGHGGMASVYRAKDLRLGRDVAVKIIHRHLRDNTEVATRFVAEARAAAKLKHRGIVEVYDVSSDEDRERYLVVELIDGKTLRQVLVDDREMPPELGAAIVLELCEAVAHAHAAGVIHRDIKPENVLIGVEQAARPATPSDSAERSSEPVRSGKPKRTQVAIKLTDFGIAKILDAQGVTSTGQVLGSPAHMAPEQIEGGDVGVKTDVFALGVILYECMVGHLPFEGKNPAQVLRRVIEGDYAPAELERPGVGAVFGKIVAGALATDARERIADADALADALRAELEALGIPDHRAEICAYFEDPAAYRAAHRQRIVPLLISRGEAARKQGVTQMAAAHFNRAHALSPDDPTILRRIAGLGASATRARLLRRSAAILATAALVGGGTYLGVRVLRASSSPDAPLARGAPTTPLPDPQGPASTASADVAPPDPSTVPAVSRSAAIVRVATASAPATSKPAGDARPRPVTFVLTPKNASLLVDGFPMAGDVQTMLTPGPHSFQIGPPTSDPCCDIESGTITVPEANKEDPATVYRIPIKAKLLKAKVKLANAPPGATAVCQGVQITANEIEVEPITYPWMANCSFNAPGQEQVKAVRSILAGRTQTVEWPAAPP